MENKPEFQLAVSIFAGISIIATGFGLWWASHYADVRPRTTSTPATEAAAPPPQANDKTPAADRAGD